MWLENFIAKFSALNIRIDPEVIKELKDPKAQIHYIWALVAMNITTKAAFAVWVVTLILRVTEIKIPIEVFP